MATSAMTSAETAGMASAAWWAVVAFAWLGLRVLGAIAVGARAVPAWSGPLLEVLLWVGGPAVLDPPILRNLSFWIGFLAMLALWVPVIGLARRMSVWRSQQVVLVAVAAFALAVQAVVTQGVVAATVVEATAGQVCQWPRKIIGFSGNLYPEPAGTTLDICVQGRPGGQGNYIGDYPGPSCNQGHARCVYSDPARAD